jgi:hypothetical protein
MARRRGIALAANQIRGESKVTIGGVGMVLVPSFSRLAKLETVTGRSVIKLLDEMVERRVTLGETVLAIELLARPEGKEKLTTEIIGAAVCREGMVRVLAFLVNAIGPALIGDEPDEKTTDDEKPPGDEGDGAGASGKGESAADDAE